MVKKKKNLTNNQNDTHHSLETVAPVILDECASKTEKIGLYDLPSEMVLRIMSFLNNRDKMALGSTSRKMYHCENYYPTPFGSHAEVRNKIKNNTPSAVTKTLAGKKAFYVTASLTGGGFIGGCLTSVLAAIAYKSLERCSSQMDVSCQYEATLAFITSTLLGISLSTLGTGYAGLNVHQFFKTRTEQQEKDQKKLVEVISINGP